MHTRKIQLIAGTTYSVSLPKEWVKKNNLKEKNEIVFNELNNGDLSLSSKFSEKKGLDTISLNIDEYLSNIDQILFAVYYLGVENINLFSKKELTKEAKTMIRKTLAHMSGSEISYENKQKINIKVLLDKSKAEIPHLLFRTSLIIEMSLTNMIEQLDIKEIRINENEIDRLYHLIAKIVLISLTDSNVLQTSKITNISLIPSYFLISKRIENLADCIKHLSEYLYKNNQEFENKKQILEFIKTETSKSINYIINKKRELFEKTNKERLNTIKKAISEIKDTKINHYLEDMLRHLVDIEEEVVNISFYNKMIKEDAL